MMKFLTRAALFAMFATTSALSAEGTGEASVASAKKAKDLTWQNWIFAGGAVVAAAIGITVVLINTGSSSNNHN